jgi:hypothetical protein
MSSCIRCAGLSGKPSTDAPHTDLINGLIERQPDWVIELFTCVTCGTTWKRKRPVGLTMHVRKLWRML